MRRMRRKKRKRRKRADNAGSAGTGLVTGNDEYDPDMNLDHWSDPKIQFSHKYTNHKSQIHKICVFVLP